MLSPEVQLLQALRKHAVELRTLAYAIARPPTPSATA